MPSVYASLEARQARICRGQLTLIVGPPAAGKSLMALNLLTAMRRPSLAFLLDIDELSAAARFGAIVSGDEFHAVKRDIGAYKAALVERTSHIHAAFFATGPDDIQLQIEAFSQRYGLPPDVLVVDNIGNLASAFENEWAVSKGLTLELDQIARREQCAVIATAHTKELAGCEPAERNKILGQISQYARLIFSVGYDPESGEFKVAVVKNSSGPTDVKAAHPITLWADPSRMSLTENSQVGVTYQQKAASGWGGF